MRTIDADALKRKVQRLATEAWKMQVKASAETILNQFIDYIDHAPTVDAVPVVRCKDCSNWCICHHSDNWLCADGTPINTASDFYDDKGKRLNNPQTYKSIYGERKDDETDKR